MKDQITVSATFPVEPKRIYNAWLNSKEHSEMTTSKASSTTKVGGSFTAWDNYISGKTLDLVKEKRILQSWRTTEFSNDDLDSFLLIKLKEVKGGTTITIIHSEIPAGQGENYKKGWLEHYFKPMKNYFDRNKITI